MNLISSFIRLIPAIRSDVATKFFYCKLQRTLARSRKAKLIIYGPEEKIIRFNSNSAIHWAENNLRKFNALNFSFRGIPYRGASPTRVAVVSEKENVANIPKQFMNFPIFSPPTSLDSFQKDFEVVALVGQPDAILKSFLYQLTSGRNNSRPIELWKPNRFVPFNFLLSHFKFRVEDQNSSEIKMILVPTYKSYPHSFDLSAKPNAEQKKVNKIAIFPDQVGHKNRFSSRRYSNSSKIEKILEELNLESVALKLSKTQLDFRCSYSAWIYNSFPRIPLIDPLENFPQLPNRNTEILNIMNKLSFTLEITNQDCEKIDTSINEIPDRETIGIIYFGNSNKLAKMLEKQTYTAWKLLKNEAEVRDFLQQNDSAYLITLDSTDLYEDCFLEVLHYFMREYSENFVAIQDETHRTGYSKDLEFIDFLTDRRNVLVRTDDPQCVEFVRGQTQELNQEGLKISFPIKGVAKVLRRENKPFKHWNPKISVVVPVFNNGEMLIARCLPSLINNEMWNDIEVLLIDDGSTDGTTVAICQWLETALPNVRSYFFTTGGSGSASRARNRGIDLATAPLISFLDPDNEISVEGYDQLYEELTKRFLKGDSPKFICGFQVKISSRPGLTGVLSGERSRIIKDVRENFFMQGRFPTISTQAALISTEFLRLEKIRFVEGAVGQDTIFGWEIALAASSFIATNRAHLIYYSERIGSVTNQMDLGFFEKALSREIHQAIVLNKYGLTEIFRQKKLESFIEEWYEPRLTDLPKYEQGEARAYIEKIRKQYE